MQAFIEYVVKALVDRPDAVVLTQAERNGATIFELRVHPTDMGKIIGRQGATVNAIRSLLLVGSAKQGLRCSLEVLDEEGARREPGESGGEGEQGAGGAERPPYRQGGGRPPFRGGHAGSGPRRGFGGGGRRSGGGSRDRY